MRTFSKVAFIVTCTCYWLTGAIIFHMLECPPSSNLGLHLKKRKNFVEYFKKKYTLASDEKVENMIEDILQAEHKNIVKLDSKNLLKWDFHDSVWFVTTIITTIGYGNIHPSTFEGKMFCCIYAIFGIPLLLINMAIMASILNNVGTLMASSLSIQLSRALKTFILTTIYVLIFILAPAIFFSAMEGWDYSDSIYYIIVTLATIGFGDFEASRAINGSLYIWLVSFWIFAGMSWFAAIMKSLYEIYLENVADQEVLGIEEDIQESIASITSINSPIANLSSCGSDDAINLLNNDERSS